MSDRANALQPLSPSCARDPQMPLVGGWRFMLLCRIANFPLIRRHLGSTRANALVHDLVEAIGQAVPEGRTSAAGRDLIEIALTGTARASIDSLLARLESMFVAPFAIDGEPYEIEFLLGASATEGALCDDVRLTEVAERALEIASGERRAVVCDVETAHAAVDRIALARDLKRAIARGELFLQYQPKVHVRRQEVTSVEALIRWEHPTRGLVLPGDFIPIAEELRVITSLTLWTIRQAIRDQRALAAMSHNLRIYVNIAGVLLGDQRFVRDACALIRDSDAKLGFEVTETSVIRDPESAIAHLNIFAEAGVTIAIDDYGAGLSSLAYLKRLPARELKIDKLFVTQLTSSNRDPLIVRSTIDLAHALEMEVVAEGVETDSALALLSVMGCDMIQGYLISRPIGFGALAAFLSEGRHKAKVADTRATFNRLAAAWKRG